MVKPLASPSVVNFVKPFTRRASCRYAPLHPATKPFSTSNTRREEEERYGNRGRDLREGTPRWKSTPARYKAPVRSKPPVLNNDFVVNEDPARLDRAYVRLLGRGGETMLTEEVKWLAVTHKSFDHGKRGYNDRLAFLGKRIVDLQTSLALLQNPSTRQIPPMQDQYGREPFRHPALEGLEGITEHGKATILDKHRVGGLAEHYGLDAVVRWKPKRMTNLPGSGLTVVISQALYAIIGAVALQKGGDVANTVVRERILNPLGLH
ncbi:hypothetical protein JMJ35_006966 [Cladonia borealis]|uniref:RNase III domain-containing protein n=1 Tax=Cladonia borealis TaxID=184061 RepID=A0AA39QY98_9LECA|nr:hypothetical protein JMJ35_006966 [Cladonia borealis]